MAVLVLLVCGIGFFCEGCECEATTRDCHGEMDRDVKVHTTTDCTMSTPPSYDQGAFGKYRLLPVGYAVVGYGEGEYIGGVGDGSPQARLPSM